MITGILTTTRHVPDGDRVSWIALDHIVAITDNPNGPGAYVESARGPLLVVQAEGIDIETAGDLVAVARIVDDGAELLARIHEAAWDLSKSPADACYRVTEILTDAGWLDPHAKTSGDAHRTRRAAEDVEEPF